MGNRSGKDATLNPPISVPPPRPETSKQPRFSEDAFAHASAPKGPQGAVPSASWVEEGGLELQIFGQDRGDAGHGFPAHCLPVRGGLLLDLLVFLIGALSDILC